MNEPNISKIDCFSIAKRFNKKSSQQDIKIEEELGDMLKRGLE